MKRIYPLAAFLTGLILPVLLITVPPVSAEVRHRTFTPEETEQMKKTEAVIETRLGKIKLRFFPDVAPNHVNNFIELARKGFYDDTTFHRVIPGFMIQGGDPESRKTDRQRHGTGSPGYSLKAEFNKKSHKRGTLSMARSRHPDSAGSQFFIVVTEAPHLDGQYTVFGEVTEGMDVVDKIVSQRRDKRDNPIEPVPMKVTIPPPAEETPPADADSE